MLMLMLVLAPPQRVAAHLGADLFVATLFAATFLGAPLLCTPALLATHVADLPDPERNRDATG